MKVAPLTLFNEINQNLLTYFIPNLCGYKIPENFKI